MWPLDTNVVSEVRKGRRCHPAVAARRASADGAHLFLSLLTIGEVRHGVQRPRPRDPSAADATETWLSTLRDGSADRIPGLDAAVTECRGRIAAGRSVPVVDALLAALAQVHRLILVTRNTADAAGLGVPVLNPFEAAP